MEGLATRADLPKMALCLGCHDGKQTTNRCGACHITEPDGRLRTNLASAATAATGLAAGTAPLVPSGVLRGFDEHGPTFARDHALAGRDERYCLTCHKRSECVDCHGGTVRPFDIHPSDYVSLHGNDARRNTPDCSSCHRTQNFCISCHQRAGVAADATGGQPGVQAHNPFGTGTQLKSFHPPGWVGDSGAPSGHAQQARRNIRSCVSRMSPGGELPSPCHLRQPRHTRRGRLAARTGLWGHGAVPGAVVAQPARLHQVPYAQRARDRLRAALTRARRRRSSFRSPRSGARRLAALGG